MKRFTIKTTLSAIFAAIGLTVAAFYFYSIERLNTVNGTVGTVVNVWMPSLEAVKDIEVRLGDIRTADRQHILMSDVAGKLAMAKLIDRSVVMLNADTVLFEKMSNGGDEAALLSKIRENFRDYMKKGNDVLALSDEGRREQAVSMLKSVMMNRAEALKNASVELTEVTKKASQAAYQNAERDFATTFRLTIAAIATLIALILGAVWFVVSNVARPIEKITAAMRDLASGDSVKPIPFAGRTDEVGVMAAAVEVFRKNAVENVLLEKDAADSRARTERDAQRHAQENAKHAEAMENATIGLAEGLRHLASGDLAFRLIEDFAPDFERLRSDFNSAVETLRATLLEVAATTGLIDGGSAEIGQSVNDLSKRTEQQASALEETAAALDQITANATQSARRADEARQASMLASESTGSSGVIVAEAVDAMVKIEQSSQQIAGIIGVIDEIAFQTNLLALNAGVETARAGDAGKGFAVVAQEVRELAQRSATAAREINALIQRSSVDVTSGVRLVKNTGEALRTIESHVNAINSNMDAIATSAKEQSIGLLQVNTAVNQMDQVTQQNAAMVEETNASSVSLASEAARLRALIQRFELGAEQHENSQGLRGIAASMRAGGLSARRLVGL